MLSILNSFKNTFRWSPETLEVYSSDYSPHFLCRYFDRVHHTELGMISQRISFFKIPSENSSDERVCEVKISNVLLYQKVYPKLLWDNNRQISIKNDMTQARNNILFCGSNNYIDFSIYKCKNISILVSMVQLLKFT